MDELRQLLFDNAALSTELRLVKEQLLQANSANLYLLSRLTANMNTARESTPPSANLSKERPAEECIVREVDFGPKEDAKNGDLLGLDNDEDSINVPPLERSARPKPEPSIGLGISNVFSPSAGVGPGRGFKVTHSDGSTTFVPTPSTETDTGTPVFLRRSLNFLPNEHNRLMGAACFVEAMTEDKRAFHWSELAQQFPRHAAEEFKEYYEEVIQPEYLTKLALRAGGGKHEVIEEKTDNTKATEHCNGDEAPESVVPTCESSFTTTATYEIPASGAATCESSFTTTTTESGPSILTPASGSFFSTVTQSNELPSFSTVYSADTLEEAYSWRFADKVTPFATAAPNVPRTISRFPRDPDPRSLFTRYPREIDDLWASGGEECHRTVVLSNIPPNVELEEIIAKAPRGNTISITHLKTAGMRTQPYLRTNGAMFVFVEHVEAEAFVKEVTENHIYFWSEGEQKAKMAHAHLLPSSSRPLRQNGPRPIFSNVLWTKGDVGYPDAPSMTEKTTQDEGNGILAAEAVRRDFQVRKGLDRSSISEYHDCIAERNQGERPGNKEAMAVGG